MIKLLKKIVVQLGGVDVSEKNHVDTYTENNIESVKGEKIATFRNGGIWISFSELNDYHFMEIHIVGFQNYKTYNGATLHFIKDKKLISQLISDCKEIESNFSNVSNRYITTLSFDVTSINLDFLLNKVADTIIFKCKNKEEEFEVI